MYDALVRSAVNFIVDMRALSDAQIAQRNFIIRNVADHVAIRVGYDSFAELNEKPNVSAVAQAIMHTREQFDDIDPDDTPDLHAAFAVAHLMYMNLVGGLAKDPDLEGAATAAMKLYALG